LTESRKRSEETAIEIKEHDIEYTKLLKECQKLAELKARQYDRELESLNTSKGKTHQEIILKLGRYLARYQFKDQQYKISAKLKRDLKGFIHRSSVYKYALPEWRDQSWKQNPSGRNQHNRATTSNLSLGSRSTEPLTTEDKRYLEAHERETIRNELIDKIVQEWTGVNKNQIPEIADRTAKGKHWAQTLLQESTNYMKDICFKMTISALHGTLEDLRILEILRGGFSDIALEVYEQRKKTESFESV